ncbi:docking protein 2 isoform X3 [Sceloporus undulatus]|uniref:docking protein 2 isoform X3 n=1 Tax=Sceloporus undulatus TaxID=8520 RepID=UPI001C4C6407|nr:docking protein 2 isoform X3 [Sceloporus undulatus]
MAEVLGRLTRGEQLCLGLSGAPGKPSASVRRESQREREQQQQQQQVPHPPEGLCVCGREGQRRRLPQGDHPLPHPDHREVLSVGSREHRSSRLDPGTVELQKDRLEDKAPASLAMDENPLYSPMSKGEKTHFPVTVRATLASERIGLGGKFLLSAQAEALELWSMQGEDALYIWPYRFLRRFGHDKVVFSFEAGRRCSSGEGSFVFVTPHGKEIIQLIEEAIDVQWGPSPRAPSRATTLPAGATRRNSSEGGTWDFAVSAPDKGQPVSHATDTTTLLNLEPGWRGKPGKDCFISVTGSSPLPTSATRSLPQQLSDSFLRGDPKDGPSVSEGPGKMVAAGSESAEPLDATHKPLANSSASWPLHDKEQVPIPSLSDDGIQGLGLAPACLGPEHVYDDPEVLVNMIYDESQELKGEAWKLRATAEDPVGHEYPYNPCLDDYSVPKMAAVPPPFQLSGKGRKGLGQAACGDRFLGFKVAKDA